MNKSIHKFPALLVLEDGTVFKGTSIGKIGTTTGEICFNTGMTGYQEVFTDPSYYGQILIQTNVHIGNYGIHQTEIESESIKIAGLVCKQFNVPYSRKQADSTVQDYFALNNIVGIADIDTRELVLHVRSKGAMNAIISSEEKTVEQLLAELKSVPSMAGLELSSQVSTQQTYYLGNEADATKRVAVLDLGVKKNILRNLTQRGCYLAVFNGKTSFADMMKFKPDGFMISNGPGDPATMEYAVDTVKTILENNIPLFGICLGHQILAEANGLKTFKMHNGHRGLNHPVKNLLTGVCEITSQNHGFAVKADDINNNPNVEVTHINLNDHTIEGIRLKNKKAFSVQYHPEAAPGPHDANYLFDDFVTLMN
ncbi:MAG: glutamine-hydrolyzing carbamoyl-phosphate synthase small subunit [Bacteroidia bacterium]|nr:glutamine-hydrolyzing carbamoyl-phosphate synthase small subunit [Bacteroidia bacterium]